MLIRITWSTFHPSKPFDLDLKGNMTPHPLIVPVEDGEIIVNPGGTCYDDCGTTGTWVEVPTDIVPYGGRKPEAPPR